MPLGNGAMVAILPAEDIGKAHVAISAVRPLDVAVKEGAVGATYLSEGERGRCNSYALRAHSIAGYMP